jgi:hypothetical protein
VSLVADVAGTLLPRHVLPGALLGSGSVERHCLQPPNVHSDIGTVRR